MRLYYNRDSAGRAGKAVFRGMRGAHYTAWSNRVLNRLHVGNPGEINITLGK